MFICFSQSVSCAFVSRILDDLVCIDKLRLNTCDSNANELFEPLKNESDRVFDELKCTTSLIINKTFSSGTIDTIIKKDDLENHQNLNSQHEHSTQNNSTLLTTTVNNNINSPKEVIESKTESFNLFNVSNDIVDLSNSLFAFANTDLVCKTSVVGATDIWAPIRAKICSQSEIMKKYASCFINTERQTQQHCNLHLEKQTTCSAINLFNKNVDCVINELNKACPTEAQEIVVNIQEQLNDEAIKHKCYQLTSDSVNKPINDDGFKLNPVNSRCSAEQVKINLH